MNKTSWLVRLFWAIGSACLLASCHSGRRDEDHGTTTRSAVVVQEERVLLAHHPEEAIAAAIMDLSSTNATVRLAGRSRISIVGKQAVPQLISFTKTSVDDSARCHAIFALGDVGDDEVAADLDGLYRIGENPLSSRQKAALVQTMRKCGGTKHLALFRRELLSEQDENLRAALAIALAELGDASGTGVFLDALKSGNASAQRVSARYLRLLYDQDFGTNEPDWREWLENNTTQSAPRD
jgi:HEAT repeat protein